MVSIKQQELQKRRTDFYSMIARGVPLQEAVKTVCAEYKISPKTAYGDWRQRDRWQVVEEPNTEQALLDCYFRLNELRRQLWQVVEDNQELGGTLKALSKLVDMELRILKTLQGAELVHVQLEDDVILRAETLHDIIVAACDDDQELEEKVARRLMDWTNAHADN